MHRRLALVLAFMLAAAMAPIPMESASAEQLKEVEIDLRVANLKFTLPELGAEYSELGGGHYVESFDVRNESSLLNYSGELMKGLFDYIWGFKGHFWQGYVGNLHMQVWVMKANSSLEKALQPFLPSEKVNLSDTSWFRSGDIERGSRIFYRKPLIGDKYLSIEFYIDDRGNDTSWRPRAMAYIESIVGSLRLVPEE